MHLAGVPSYGSPHSYRGRRGGLPLGLGLGLRLTWCNAAPLCDCTGANEVCSCDLVMIARRDAEVGVAVWIRMLQSSGP